MEEAPKKETPNPMILFHFHSSDAFERMWRISRRSSSQRGNAGTDEWSSNDAADDDDDVGGRLVRSVSSASARSSKLTLTVRKCHSAQNKLHNNSLGSKSDQSTVAAPPF
jgi:hypothetical protein